MVSADKYHILLRDEFLPISHTMFDPQHVYFSGGIFDTELEAFMDRLEAADCGLGCSSLDAYLKCWTWPKAYGNASTLCSRGYVQGCASTYLSVAPVMREWVGSVVMSVGMCSSRG